MELELLIKKYEDAKEKILPLLKKHHLVAPILKLAKDEKGLYRGNGFCLDEDGRLFYSFTNFGWSVESKPEDLYNSFEIFRRKISKQIALELATKALNNFYECHRDYLY
jgi:hypothetical protein